MMAFSPEAAELDPLSLILSASGPIRIIVWLLLCAAIAVWAIAVVKTRQLRRWSEAQARLDDELSLVVDAITANDLARRHPEALGAAVLGAASEATGADADAMLGRVIVQQQRRIAFLMPVLSSIAAVSPFVGLLGTVYGIMDAFLRIGREKSASLPVVAPAIGEALVVTAIGLFAAIPAVVAYNLISARSEELVADLQAFAKICSQRMRGG